MGWATRPSVLWAAAVAAVLATILTVSAPDPAGRVLFGLAAVGLTAAAAFGAVARPRLRVDRGGLTLRGATGRRELAWSEVEDVAVVRTRRLGRTVAVLEISPREPGGLIVLTRLDLGADPDDVLAHLLAVRGGGPYPGPGGGASSAP